MKKIIYWLPVVLWAAFIFYISSRQGPELPFFPFPDKVMHAIVYAVMGFFTARSLIKGHYLRIFPMVIVATLMVGLYGVSDEVHQMYVPTRSPEILDLISDFFGGFLGSLLYGFLSRISEGN